MALLAFVNQTTYGKLTSVHNSQSKGEAVVRVAGGGWAPEVECCKQD